MLMLKYISTCYSYICETISKRLEYLYGVNRNQLEEENEYYCKMTDGGFVIKENIPKTKEERIQYGNRRLLCPYMGSEARH
jgi:hypothetical protein